MNLIPKINGTYAAHADTLWIPGSIRIQSSPRFEKAIDVFIGRIRARAGIALSKTDSAYAEIAIGHDPSLPSEGYRLQCAYDGVSAWASTEQGMNWALTTLYHLGVDAVTRRQNTLRAFSLQDAPRYGHRGLMVDVARHFFPYEEMLRIIEQMALLKLNVLHLHLADDQGWRVESRVHPALNAVTDATDLGGHYTQEQVRDMVAFAAARGVEIIPEVDMPGHATAMVAAYPTLSCAGEPVAPAARGGIYHNLLCPGKDGTLAWVFALLDELCGLFPSSRIHIGGDEAPKAVWKQCPYCQARIQAKGLAQEEQLQGWFLNQVIEHLKGKGKQVICWNECLLADNLSGDVTVQFWLDMVARSDTFPAVQTGRSVILSNVGHFYFDYGHAVTPLRRIYEYAENIQGHGVQGLPNVLGMEGAVWTENIPTPERLEYQLFPRLAALAECAWSQERSMACFLERLRAYYEEWRAAQIQAAPLEDTLLEGAARIQAAADFFRKMLANFDLQQAGFVEHPQQTRAFLSGLLSNFFDEADLPALLDALLQ